MPIRVSIPGGLGGGTVGRVYVVHYPGSMTLEFAKQAQEDYVAFTDTVGGTAVPMLMLADKPVPLATVDVRRYWRASAGEPPGFEGIALVTGGVVGLMAATITHLGEQLVAVLGVHFRSFRDVYEGAAWLCDTFETEATPDEIVRFVAQMRAIHDGGASPGDEPDPG